VFASPGAAQDAKNQLEELDGMFFSRQPSDHAALAARIHELSPEAFRNFAKAVQAHAAKVSANVQQGPGVATSADATAGAGNPVSPAKPEQLELFPSQASDSGNAPSDPGQVSRQIGQQSSQQNSAATPVGGQGVHEAQPSVAQAAPVQPAAASAGDSRGAAQAAFFNDTNAAAVVAGRAKQALPAVAKRVIGEWTQSIVAANHERLSRHEAASKRVDIARRERQTE
jgi:hypothetical protein